MIIMIIIMIGRPVAKRAGQGVLSGASRPVQGIFPLPRDFPL